VPPGNSYFWHIESPQNRLSGNSYFWRTAARRSAAELVGHARISEKLDDELHLRGQTHRLWLFLGGGM